MTDALVISVVNSVCAMVLGGFIAWLDRRQSGRAKKAAAQVEKVRDTLAGVTDGQTRKLDGLAKVARSSHAFLNSEKSVILRKLAESLRIAADATGDPAHVAAAESAEQDYRDHMAAQREVDAQPGTDAQKEGNP